MIGLVAVAGVPAAAVDSRTKDADTPAFEQIIARIRAAEASKEWQKPGWKDDAIEKPLRKVVAEVVRVTNKDFLKLPVAFQDVGGDRDDRQAFAAGDGLLRVASGNLEIAHAQKSIFLVDGNIRISHAQDCIVLARGAVDVGHSNRNLIVAGQHVNISFDGHDALRDGARPTGRGGPPMKHGSVVLSGGTMQIAHAQGTVCSAPDSIAISHAMQVSFLGSNRRGISHETDCSDYSNARFPIAFAKTRQFPGEALRVNQVVAPDDRTQQLVIVERNQLEYVLRPGARLTDEKRQPISDWTEWKLGFVTDDYALFTNGQQDISYFLKPSP